MSSPAPPTAEFLYALIARGTVVLAEKLRNSQQGSDLPNISRQLLPKIPQTQNHRKSYSYGEQIFHYLLEDNITVLCVATTSLAHRIAHSFLADIRHRFQATFGGDSLQSAGELAYQDQFARTLDEQMEFFAHDPSADKIRRVRGEIASVMTTMQQNVERALDRGGAIESLVERTTLLETDSQQFKKRSTQLKQKLWWKNCWLWVVIVVIVVLLLAGVAAVVLWKIGLLLPPPAPAPAPAPSPPAPSPTAAPVSSPPSSTTITIGSKLTEHVVWK